LLYTVFFGDGYNNNDNTSTLLLCKVKVIGGRSVSDDKGTA